MFRKERIPSWKLVAPRVVTAITWIAKGENCEPKDEIDCPTQSFMKSACWKSDRCSPTAPSGEVRILSSGYRFWSKVWQFETQAAGAAGVTGDVLMR